MDKLPPVAAEILKKFKVGNFFTKSPTFLYITTWQMYRLKSGV